MLTFDWDFDLHDMYETSGQTVSISAAGLEVPASRTVRVRVTSPSGDPRPPIQPRSASSGRFARFSPWPEQGSVLHRGRPRPDRTDASFGLDGDQGMAVPATGYPRSGSYTCGGDPLLDANDPTTGGGLAFSVDSGLYTYPWKTNKPWATTCRTFVLKLADGTYHYVDVFFDK